MGTQLPLQKGHSPQFLADVYCGQTAGWIKIELGMEVGLGPGHIVLDGDPAPLLTKRGQSPQFSAHFYCGQTTGCIKMPLGMEVGLSPVNFVLDGDPAPRPLKGHSPQFSANVHCGQTAMGTQLPPEKGHIHPTQFLAHVCCSQTAGWMKTPLGMEVDLAPGHIVLDQVPALRERGTAAPRLFGPCLMWPPSPISAAAELLSGFAVWAVPHWSTHLI